MFVTDVPKVTQTALTSMGWYDFVGSDYSKEEYLSRCQHLDNVFQHYADAEAMTVSMTNRPPGLTLSRYYVHLEIARSILVEFGIHTEPLVFIFESQLVVYKEGDVKREAITALFERDVSEKILQNWQESPMADFVPLSESLV